MKTRPKVKVNVEAEVAVAQKVPKPARKVQIGQAIARVHIPGQDLAAVARKLTDIAFI